MKIHDAKTRGLNRLNTLLEVEHGIPEGEQLCVLKKKEIIQYQWIVNVPLWCVSIEMDYLALFKALDHC